MPYRNRIKTLEDAYTLIEKRIENKEGDVSTLIEQKSIVQKELSNFRRLQWDHDHERVDLDDDR